MKSYLSIFLSLILLSIANAQPTIDGNLEDSEYSTLAEKQNTNSGFGPNIDVSKIVYYVDVANEYIYLGVVGKLDITNNNGIGLWLNIGGTSSPSGKSAGQSLGIPPSGGHYIGADSGNFKADFEVDYMFAFNPGNSSTTVYFDAAKHVNSSVKEYQGSCNQSGSSATNSNANGTVFSQNSITFAFDNSGNSNRGLELKIPFAQLGASSSHTLEVFTFVVSNTAYFSDVTVPGNVSGGNLGFNPDFGNINGGPYHSSAQPLPVVLTSFNVFQNNSKVVLTWSTSTEVNNYGFEIERQKLSPTGKAIEETNWKTIGFIQGNGNSNVPRIYTYTDRDITNGKYAYRLKQIDYDGKYEYSKTVEIDVKLRAEDIELVAYPNPFNPETKIKYSIPDGIENAKVEVKLYDVVGQEIKTLYAGEQESGVYEIDLRGEQLTTGVYLVKLNVNEKSKLVKLILIK